MFRFLISVMPRFNRGICLLNDEIPRSSRGMTLFLFSLLVFSTPTNAARFSGQYLLHMCGSDKTGAELTEGGHIACQAYIAGVMDYHALLRSMGTAPSIDFCVPEAVPINLVQAQVTSHVFRNQKQHNGFIAAPAVALGLFQNYPCE